MLGGRRGDLRDWVETERWVNAIAAWLLSQPPFEVTGVSSASNPARPSLL